MPPLSCTSVAAKQADPPSAIAEEVKTTSEQSGEEDRKVEDEAQNLEKTMNENIEQIISKDNNISSHQQSPVPTKIVWRNVFLFAYLHLLALWGLWRVFSSAKWQTNIFAFILYIFSGMGVTAGAHRLWAHRSYKAKLPLRIFLAFIYTVAFENDIFEWARDHRVHHKYSETDADPHNAKRGFFFAHIGWLLCRKHPEVIKKGKAIDLKDLLDDPVVRFQRKFYLPLVLLCCFVLPTVVPVYFWSESWLNAFLIPTIFRYCFTLNQTWLVNSAAHMWGSRPYDVHINPRENALVVLGAVGEGFHNYHHTFPYDYATSEYGVKYNITTAFIDCMAWLGQAYDCKTVSKATIKARKIRTGPDSFHDGTNHQEVDHSKEN